MEKSAGVIIFRKEKENIYYLLLRYQSLGKKGVDYWGFPKGHIEGSETEKETATREVLEETSIKDLRFVKDFKYLIDYSFRKEGKIVFKTVTFFIAETNTKKVRVSFEHIGYQWIKYNQAIKELNFANDIAMLKKAHRFITKK
ncbi:MAG: NUDIX domain-containing protein [Candidatus Pacebacteria bacterium]|jgi:bis(5'-nucleosidyl)-tetraphosphatase|nr:NUDIX domain-containing protein [Candidatus Paceibacterota bacterium]